MYICKLPAKSKCSNSIRPTVMPPRDQLTTSTFLSMALGACKRVTMEKVPILQQNCSIFILISKHYISGKLLLGASSREVLNL